MTISEVRQKCKDRAAKIPRDVLLVGILLAASLLSFMLGYLAGNETEKGSGMSSIASPAALPGVKEQVVASHSGTKYYPPLCPAAVRLSEASKVWFASAALAEEAGYTAAAHCANY